MNLGIYYTPYNNPRWDGTKWIYDCTPNYWGQLSTNSNGTGSNYLMQQEIDQLKAEIKMLKECLKD